MKDIIRAEFDNSYAQPEDIQEGENGDGNEEDAEASMCKNGNSLNIFDNLSVFSAPRIKKLCDDLDRYLSTDPEHVVDVLAWWTERKSTYPCLSRMALDYLSIPGELITQCMLFRPSNSSQI